MTTSLSPVAAVVVAGEVAVVLVVCALAQHWLLPQELNTPLRLEQVAQAERLRGSELLVIIQHFPQLHLTAVDTAAGLVIQPLFIPEVMAVRVAAGDKLFPVVLRREALEIRLAHHQVREIMLEMVCIHRESAPVMVVAAEQVRLAQRVLLVHRELGVMEGPELRHLFLVVLLLMLVAEAVLVMRGVPVVPGAAEMREVQMHQLLELRELQIQAEAEVGVDTALAI